MPSGGTALGALINGITSVPLAYLQKANQSDLNREQYVLNSLLAQQERDWQTQMSNTAYQRAVSDMKAAGINPASLSGVNASAASSGMGASSGGMTSGQALMPSVNTGSMAQLYAYASKDKELALKLAQAQNQSIVEEAKANYYNSAASYQNALANNISKKDEIDSSDIFIKRL